MRPYRGRRERFDIVDPLLEPFWSGDRVLAHVSRPGAIGAPDIRLVDRDGADLAPGLAGLCRALDDSILADDAVVDGIVSRQVLLSGIGTAPVAEFKKSSMGFLLRGRSDVDVKRRDEPAIDEAPAGSETSDIGFVAVDLLRVDGSDLLDVPLLERKRLLESVVAESQLVRVSAHVRPPIEGWLATWKSLGLRGGMLKAANSRYEPGGLSVEWSFVGSVRRSR
jgi:ATP-dependent DNA ligase